MGETTLSLAAFGGQLDILELMLEDSRLDVVATDKNGRIALWQPRFL